MKRYPTLGALLLGLSVSAVPVLTSCGGQPEPPTAPAAKPPAANANAAGPAAPTAEEAALEKEVEEALEKGGYDDVTVEVKNKKVYIKGKMRATEQQKAITKIVEDIAFARMYSVSTAFST